MPFNLVYLKSFLRSSRAKVYTIRVINVVLLVQIYDNIFFGDKNFFSIKRQIFPPKITKQKIWMFQIFRASQWYLYCVHFRLKTSETIWEYTIKRRLDYPNPKENSKLIFLKYRILKLTFPISRQSLFRMILNFTPLIFYFPSKFNKSK